MELEKYFINSQLTTSEVINILYGLISCSSLKK